MRRKKKNKVLFRKK